MLMSDLELLWPHLGMHSVNSQVLGVVAKTDGHAHFAYFNAFKLKSK